MPVSAATYWSHWGLRQTPFRAAAGSDLCRLSATHEEAIARLHFLVENGRRLGLLLGELGSGKTLLLSRFAKDLLSQGIDVILLGGYGTDAHELVCAVARGLGITPRRDEPLHAVWAKLTDRLVERRYQRLATVLLFDDADRAADNALAAAVRLLQVDSSTESRLTLIAASEPQRTARLGGRLLDLVELRVDLEAWTKEEMAEYVRLSLAGAGRREPLFDEGAVARLHELSGGRPRRVGQIADLALVAAAGQDRTTIDAQTIDAVFRELTVAN
jgi:type II secretory pathway predicted ATPase ExeA